LADRCLSIVRIQFNEFGVLFGKGKKCEKKTFLENGEEGEMK
jgi:hypothetical protein